MSLLSGCAATTVEEAAHAPTSDVAEVLITPMERLTWRALNPARGDASPMASTLWGDRHADAGPTAFLVRFVDGFSSPPHVHNVTYRALVLDGEVHNAGPDEPVVWMPPGSYWTQSAGGVHITSSRGASMALVEIDTGPYLVRPPSEASLETAGSVNTPSPDIGWHDDADGTARVAPWASRTAPGASATLMRISAGASASVPTVTGERNVVVSGSVHANGGQSLDPGSLIAARSDGTLRWECASGVDCVIYRRRE